MSEIIRVLGIDLACRRWGDNGTALLTFRGGANSEWQVVEHHCIAWPNQQLNAESMADVIDSFAIKNGIAAVSLDGPQGWREPTAPPRLGVGRQCEYEARTQGKTGAYGITYPGTQRAWFNFCIEVFDLLTQRHSGVIVNGRDPAQIDRRNDGKYWVLECFPTSTWRHSNLAPLPGKGRMRNRPLDSWSVALWQRYTLPNPGQWQGTHDDLQAVVAALPAAALLRGPCRALALGQAGWHVDGNHNPRHWVEGIIWDATPPDERLQPPIEIALPQNGGDDGPDVPQNPILIDERDDDGEQCLERGVVLFHEMVRLANVGESVGIGFAQFAQRVHGAETFQQIAGRQFAPADVPHVLNLARQITAAAGGRQKVNKNGIQINVGVDTFIWRVDPPFERPVPAFANEQFTQADWRAAFPDTTRRLLRDDEGVYDDARVYEFTIQLHGPETVEIVRAPDASLAYQIAQARHAGHNITILQTRRVS